MSPEDRIQSLETELQALRYWFRILFAATSRHHDIDAAEIEQIISQAKNVSPEDMPWVAEGRFDQVALRYLPAIERLGHDIALVLPQCDDADSYRS